LKEALKALFFFLDLNFELSFKIILIQKSQIYIFRENLNLFELENVFDLNLNLDFKFKYVQTESAKPWPPPPIKGSIDPASSALNTPLSPVSPLLAPYVMPTSSNLYHCKSSPPDQVSRLVASRHRR
jgi:hypothetical protein